MKLRTVSLILTKTSVNKILLSYYKLRPRYKKVSSIVVLFGSIIGILLWIGLVSELRQSLGLPAGETSLEGIEFQAAVWIATTIVSAPLIVMVSIMAVALGTGLILVVMGPLTFQEAIRFSLRGRYPASWFADDRFSP